MVVALKIEDLDRLEKEAKTLNGVPGKVGILRMEQSDLLEIIELARQALLHECDDPLVVPEEPDRPEWG